jgi:hypothetical protein
MDGVPYKLGTQTSSHLMHLVVANTEYLPPSYQHTRRTSELLSSTFATPLCGQAAGQASGRPENGVANYTSVSCLAAAG